MHSPVRGVVRGVLSLPGDYYPVNSIGMRHVPNLFVRNRRVVIHIDAEPSSKLGRVAVVMVSAMIVGRITVSGIAERDVPMGEHTLHLPIDKGDEIGMFHLGSTAVLFVERGAHAAWTVSEGPVRYGERIATSAHGPASGGAGSTSSRGSV